MAGSQGRRVAGPGWAGCVLSVSRGWAKWIGANEAANGRARVGPLRGSLGNLGRRLQHCVELVPVPTTDLRLEITRKGPLRCVGWLPPAFENVSPNVRWKPSKPSKHSRASTLRHATGSPRLAAACCWLVRRPYSHSAARLGATAGHLDPDPHCYVLCTRSRPQSPMRHQQRGSEQL